MDETKTAAPAGKGAKGKKAKKAKPAKPKKEKKPKAPKPKKAKKGKGGEGEEGEGKRGPNKKLLILLIGIVVLMGVAAFLVIKVFKLFPALLPEDDTPTETSAPGEPGEVEGPGEEGEPGEVELVFPEGPEDPEATPSPTPTQRPAEIHTQITNAQVKDFIESLSPSVLGLDGEDMSHYEMFASEDIVPIDGLYCTEVRVYSKNPSAGTNDIEGIYYVSRGNVRRVYRYDEFENTVTEIPLR